MPLCIQKIKFLWSGFEVINLFIFVPLTWRFLMHKKTLKWFWGRPGLLSWQLSADNFLLTPPILQSLLWTAIKTVDLLVLSHKISDCSKWIVYSSGCWNRPASNWNPEGKSTFGRLVDRSWANARRKICLIAGSPRWCIGKCHQFMFAANLEHLCIPHAVVLMVVSGIFGVSWRYPKPFRSKAQLHHRQFRRIRRPTGVTPDLLCFKPLKQSTESRLFVSLDLPAFCSENGEIEWNS